MTVLASLSLAEPAYATEKQKCLDAGPRGQDLRDQGKLLEAAREFMVCADTSCPEPVPAYCAQWLDEVKKRVPSLLVRVTDASGRDVPDAVLTIDGLPAALDGRPIELDPGPHRARVTRPGWRDAEQPVVLLEGERDRRILVRLEAAPSEKSSPRSSDPSSRAHPVPLASWIAWGIGAVGLASFTAFGIKAKVDYDGYRSSCGDQCARSATNDVERSMVIADASLAVGVVGAVVGTLVYLMAPTAPERKASPLGSR
jgi:hypothetical protein